MKLADYLVKLGVESNDDQKLFIGGTSGYFFIGYIEDLIDDIPKLDKWWKDRSFSIAKKKRTIDHQKKLISKYELEIDEYARLYDKRTDEYRMEDFIKYRMNELLNDIFHPDHELTLAEIREKKKDYKNLRAALADLAEGRTNDISFCKGKIEATNQLLYDAKNTVKECEEAINRYLAYQRNYTSILEHNVVNAYVKDGHPDESEHGIAIIIDGNFEGPYWTSDEVETKGKYYTSTGYRKFGRPRSNRA